MKILLPLLSLLALFLAGCGKDQAVVGFYANGPRAYEFAANGSVQTHRLNMPTAGVKGSYKQTGQEIRVDLENGVHAVFNLINGDADLIVPGQTGRETFKRIDPVSFLSKPVTQTTQGNERRF